MNLLECVIKGRVIIGQTHPWVVSLKTFNEWLRNQKWPNHFLGRFPLNVFKTINFFPHVYPLHTLIHGLKFILKFKKVKLLRFCIPNKNGPFGNHQY
jgi:hypothetical protein